MTKARDIASAAPAPSTVSTTELGYLDGVSSAIQTQLDGKASTTADIPKSLIDAKGDLIVGSANDTPAILSIGTNDYVLTADSTQSTGMKWAAVASGNQIIQIVQSTYTTETNSSSSTYADTGLTATITPTSTSNKILVILTHSACRKGGGANDTFMAMKLVRSGTDIAQVTDYAGASTDHKELYFGNISYSYLDSPATTSSRTYKTQFASVSNLASVGVQVNSGRSTMQLIEISGV